MQSARVASVSTKATPSIVPSSRPWAIAARIAGREADPRPVMDELARANDVILKEEEGHKNFGEACLEQMCRDPATRAEIQRRFTKWFVASMRIFGRAGTAGNRYCLEVGLKTRDSGDVAAAYLDSIRPVMARCGLQFPQRANLSLELPPQIDLSVPVAATVS